MNIIKEVFDGNLTTDSFSAEFGREQSEILDMVIENEEKLNKCLNEDDKKIFLKFAKAQENFFMAECCEQFVAGWKMGAKFILDTFIMP